MKTTVLMLLAVLVLNSCSNNDDNGTALPQDNKVLLLKIDYNTNVFEEGVELGFEDANDFTINVAYQAPGDFGGIQLYYEELDELLFDGSIHWMGLGSIAFPETFQPASSFEVVLTNDYVFPAEGFENIFNPNNQVYDYEPIWNAVQSRVKVRQYLAANPDATVKLFLYTPSVGIGNPAEWDWIMILKN